MKVCTVFITGLLALGSTAQALPSPARLNPGAQRSPAQAASAAPSKKDVLAQLKRLQDKQIAESTELENAIRKQLNETIKLEIGDDDLGVAGRRTNLVTKKIDELNKRRTELGARREIVDRLIFQIDTKWDGHSPLKNFLTSAFIEMASTDLSDGRDNRLWKEFTYLSMVMREVPEKGDDVVSIFEGYLNFSSVLDPKTPAEFMASRNYTNGLESAQARTAERSSLGDGLTPPTGQRTPLEIRTALGIPPAPSEEDGTLSATTLAPPQATLAPPQAAIETADKAQFDTGQVPMSEVAPAGKADGLNATPAPALKTKR